MECKNFEIDDFRRKLNAQGQEDENGMSAPEQLSALLREALANPQANRARFSVSADELGIPRRSIAVRIDPTLTGKSGAIVFHNVTVVGVMDYATMKWDERDRNGAWAPVDRHTEILVEWWDEDGAFQQERFEGVLAASIESAASHFQDFLK